MSAAVAQCLDENVRNYIVCVPLRRGVHSHDGRRRRCSDIVIRKSVCITYRHRPPLSYDHTVAVRLSVVWHGAAVIVYNNMIMTIRGL